MDFEYELPTHEDARRLALDAIVGATLKLRPNGRDQPVSIIVKDGGGGVVYKITFVLKGEWLH